MALRIALANIRVPGSPEESISLAQDAIADAGRQGASILCFPECYVPGYPILPDPGPRPDAAFLDSAWKSIAKATAQAGLTVLLGTERIVDGARHLSVLVFNPDGTQAGFQDKVQLDPPEEALYSPAVERRVFQAGPVTFGVAICHEGFRYPETVRWAVRNGAQIVFHPHFTIAEPGSYRPQSYADPANSFHEKAALCRAAENTCFFATVNCASEGSPTTSAVIRPDGSVLCYQPYGAEGLLIADLNLEEATRKLAMRCRS